MLYAWLANGSGGSILIAILAHAGFNIAAGCWDGIAFIEQSARKRLAAVG